LFSQYVSIFNRIFLRLQGYLMNTDMNLGAAAVAGPGAGPPGAGPPGGPFGGPDDEDMDLNDDDDDAPPNIRIVPAARSMEIPNPAQAVFQQPRVAVPQPRQQESHPAMGDFRFVPPEPVSSRLRPREGPAEDEPTKKKSKKEKPFVDGPFTSSETRRELNLEHAAGGHKHKEKKPPAKAAKTVTKPEPAAAEKNSKKGTKTKNYPAVPDLSKLNRGPAEHRDVIPPAVPEAGAPGRPRVRKAKERADDTAGGKKRRYRNPPDTTPHIPYPPAPPPPPPPSAPSRRRRATPEGL
jgi:hypothetical protein